MDEERIWKAVQRCKHLQFKLNGIYACNNFPPLRGRQSQFQIVNTSPFSTIGTHWVLFVLRSGKVIFADPLGKPLQHYKQLFKRCVRFYNFVTDLLVRIQPPTSNKCAIYCLYLAHVIFGHYYPQMILVDEYTLDKFVSHFL